MKQKLIKNKTSDYLFATKKSGKISQGYVRKLIDELVKELRWSKKVTCHTLRHSFATSLLRKNVSLVHISRLLGHSSLRVTELYVHLVQDELVDAIEKL
ncbi:tyrosine-type recombinase/integrase [Brevibacillus choshinensis]|uniref:tyrosine-type recombinase/integrase n=1 Tax=Brevibacillus choshinensis TaxID=54911 RepID=UPI002E1C3124|nr:tyrosine-type recombinase/integrase [Brevibacillus choshinensis]MED4780351.1 tyrosine-type recombinase/integrase [Brevibacillus choshinensis]